MTQQYPPPGQWDQYPSPYQAPAPPATNVLAAISLIASILWLCWLGSFIAVIAGHIARAQIKDNGQSGDTLAVIGLVLGYLGIVVLAGFLGLAVLGGIGASTTAVTP